MSAPWSARDSMMERPLSFETGGPSWMIVLFEKQVHLQKEVGSVAIEGVGQSLDGGRRWMRWNSPAARTAET